MADDLRRQPWWTLMEAAACMGSPALGRASANRPGVFGVVGAAIAAFLLLLDHVGPTGLAMIVLVIFVLLYGNGLLLRWYCDQGGTFRDGRGRG